MNSQSNKEIKHFVSGNKKAQDVSQEEKDDLIVYAALKFPQYTISDLYEKIPYKLVVRMVKIARKDDAEFFLKLNTIINGPNSKDKSHKAYKELIESLIKVIEPNKKKTNKSIEDQNAELLRMSMGMK